MKKTLTALSVLALMSAPLAAQDAAPKTDAPAAITFAEQQNETQVLATDFTGETVLTTAGEKVGDINNLVFDENGRIALAVIGVGGFMGVGEKEVAVPFETLKPDMRDGKQVLIVSATKEQIEAAPAYKTLNDQRFAERVSTWKEKAKEGWARVSEEAKQAYDQAKTAVQSATEKATDGGTAAPSGTANPPSQTN